MHCPGSKVKIVYSYVDARKSDLLGIQFAEELQSKATVDREEPALQMQSRRIHTRTVGSMYILEWELITQRLYSEFRRCRSQLPRHPTVGCRRAGACVFHDTKTYASRLNLAPARKGAKLAPNGYLLRRASKQDAALIKIARLFSSRFEGFRFIRCRRETKRTKSNGRGPPSSPKEEINQPSRRSSIPRIRPPPLFLLFWRKRRSKNATKPTPRQRRVLHKSVWSRRATSCLTKHPSPHCS